MKKFSICILNLLILFCFTYNYSYAFSESYIWSSPSILSTEVSNNLSSKDLDDTQNPLNLDCGSCILIEQTSGQILYSYNAHEKLRPASVTKLMSIYLIMEALHNGKINYDTKIPCSKNAESMGGSQIWLDTTETLSVNDMLKAIAVVSANDCVTAMAEYLGGTEENFVQMMNDKAKELGMNDTTFKNCHGLDEDEHLTSAYDIALMSRELLVKHPAITNYSTIWTDTLRDGKSALSNTNKLVRNYAGCTGLKTGSTSLALFNLSASATRDGLSLIAVIMKAPTSALRFSNAIKLLDYGFTNYSYKSFANRGDFIRQISVTKGIDSIANVVYETSPSFLVKKGEESKITYELNLPDTVSAPISKGQQLGTITYYSDGAKLDTVNLISDSTINKISFISMIKHISYNWLNLLRM